MARKIKNLKGKHFGRWTVLSMSLLKKGANVCWDCYCDPKYGGCGYKTSLDNPINGASLRSGHSTSCRCLRNEVLSSVDREAENKDRDEVIVYFIEYGIPRNKIADKFGLTRQRVHQIYHKEKSYAK